MSEPDLRANPYVGLRPFFTDDSLYFFGRDQQISELLCILRQHRFLGVVGSSGSGKSSLVRAGLLPSLLGGFLVHDRDRWRTVQIKPGDAPIGNLASGLVAGMEPTPTLESVAQLDRDVREGHTDAVIEFLAPRLERNANLFLLVDQFEEIFNFRGVDEEDAAQSADLARRKERARRKAEAADFVDLLLALAEQEQLPIYVVLTMRSDFLGDCDLFYGLPEALNRGRYLVPRMTREQLREAVECPALVLDAQLAPRLIDHLLNELGDRFDRLPVLQHALLRTWDEWQRAGRGGPVDLRHYQLAGGLQGALDQDAEAALKGLDENRTARVFKRLTDTDLSQRRVRSPARISELMTAAGADRNGVEAIVRRFEENGRSFVYRSADGKPDDPRVDISHESLIRQWNQLRTWVDEERRSRDEYRELVKKARRRAQGEAALLQDPELQMAVDWKQAVNPSAEWAARYSVSDGDFECALAYLDDSVDTQRRDLAGALVRRRWEKIWGPMTLALEIVAGMVLARLTGLLEHITFFGYGGDGKTVDLWAEFQRVFINQEFLLRQLPPSIVFLAACVGLTYSAKTLHRKLAFPGALKSIAARAERKATEVTAAPRQAAADAALPYAPTVRRMAGTAIDFAIFLLVVAVLYRFVPTSYGDLVYVLTKGPETVSGVYLSDFEDDEVSVTQGEGDNAWTLSFTGSVTYKGPDGEQTTYPVRQRVYDLPDSEVSIGFWDGPTLTGTLVKGDEEWSLTLTSDQDVPMKRFSSETIKAAKGTTVTFPAPDPDAWDLRYDSPGASDAYAIGYAVVCLVFGWLYGALQVTSQRKATLGMRAVGIYRTGLNGERLTFGKASALFGFRILSVGLYGLGFVPQLFTKHRQTFPDWMTGSVVLRGPSPTSTPALIAGPLTTAVKSDNSAAPRSYAAG
jgi:hypothetical protein